MFCFRMPLFLRGKDLHVDTWSFVPVFVRRNFMAYRHVSLIN